MTYTLTPELAQAVAAADGNGLRLKNPDTNQEYVLIKAELYDRIHNLVLDEDDGFSMHRLRF